MADYTEILDDELVPDAPITSLLGFRFRDNPIAIAEGSADAERIRVGALQRLTAGTNIRSRADSVVEVTAGNTGIGHSFAFAQAGTIRVTFEHNTSGLGAEVNVTRVRNGTATVIATYGTTAGYTARSVDVSVLPGDDVRIVAIATSPSNFLRNMRFQTGGEDLFPGAACNLEGNTYA
jgi:hypothetical protein